MRHPARVLSGSMICSAIAVFTTVSVGVSGQGRGAAPPAPAGSSAPQGRGRGVAPVDRPGPNDKMVVDPAEADKGRTIWASECVTCHGANARGGDGGPNLVRSAMVLPDRYGSGLGPFLKEGHPMQSGRPSTALTDDQVVQLSHFLRQRITDTLRGSPLFDVKDVLTGDPKSGAAFFNGEGKCATCHSATGDLAGIGTRLTPVNIQQRFIFPVTAGRGRGRGGATTPASTRTAITITVTPPGGQAITGTRLEEDDFFVTLREPSGTVRTIKRLPGTTVTTSNPLQFHIDLLERITDKQMHDVVAYLETLK
jgi:cytochrome c oxidase cbb3-type subunit III